MATDRELEDALLGVDKPRKKRTANSQAASRTSERRALRSPGQTQRNEAEAARRRLKIRNRMGDKAARRKYGDDYGA